MFYSFIATNYQELLKSQTEIPQTIAAARRIVTQFNHSGKAQRKLISIQRELNLPSDELVQDVSICWNSIYYLSPY